MISNTFYSYILTAALELLRFFLLFLCPVFVMCFLVNYLSAYVEKLICRIVGIRTYLVCFGWLSTVVHESGHALFCILFGHRIKEISFFSPMSGDDRLGYVNHTFNPRNVYQVIGNLFIGLGPVFLGSVILFVSAYYLLDFNVFSFVTITGNSELSGNISMFPDILRNVIGTGKALLEYSVSRHEFYNWQLYLFVYIAFAVGSSMSLSSADMKGMGWGLMVFLGILFLLNLAALWAGNWMQGFCARAAGFYSVFCIIMLFTMFVQLLLICIISPLWLLRRH